MTEETRITGSGQPLPHLDVEHAPAMQFNVARLVEVPPSVEAAAKAAIEDVWSHEAGIPSSVNVVFARRVIQDLDDNSKEQVNACYMPDEDKILIALYTISARHDGSPLEMITALFAAHETQHKVQLYRGESPNPAHETMANGAYYNDPHEIDAWDSAFRSFNRLYPGARYSFTIGSRRYSAPSSEPK